MKRYPYIRGTQLVRPFSRREDRLITQWRIEGWGTTRIARELLAATGSARTPATINMRLKTLAKNEDGEAPAARHTARGAA